MYRESHAPPPEPIRYSSIEVTVEGIAETSAAGQAVFLGRNDIAGIALCYGSLSEHPASELRYGLLCLGIGIAIATAGRHTTGNIVCAVVAIALGGFLLSHIVRRRYHLRIYGRNESRVFRLRGRVGPQAVLSFLERVRREHGYHVESRVAGLALPPHDARSPQS